MEMASRMYHTLEFNFKLDVNPEFQECTYCLLNFRAKPPPHLSSLESHINFSKTFQDEPPWLATVAYLIVALGPLQNGCTEKCGQSLKLREPTSWMWCSVGNQIMV